MGGGESKTAVVAALLGNLLIAILKLVAGLIAGSAAMLAESAHSFSDVGNQFLLMLGISRANRPPTPEHPYGTSKAAYFWPFLVAVLLFGVAGAYSLFEGIEKVRHPHEVADIRLALAVLGASFLIEIVSLTIAFRAAQKAARSAGIGSVREWMRENRDATLLTVLVEDGLALAGLPVAAAALVLTKWTGNPVWDAVGSIVIGVMLMGFALFLAREVKSLLLGRGLSPRHLAEVHLIVSSDPAVQHIDNLQSMYLGPNVVLLGVEVDMVDSLNADQVERALERIEGTLIAKLPMLKYVYLEPRKRAIEHAGTAAPAVLHKA